MSIVFRPFQHNTAVHALAFTESSSDRVDHGEVLSASEANCTGLFLQFCTNIDPPGGVGVDQYRCDILKQNHGIRYGINGPTDGVMLFKRNGTSGLDQYVTNANFLKQNRWQWIAFAYNSTGSTGERVKMYSAEFGAGLLTEWSGYAEQLDSRTGYEDISGDNLIIGNRHSTYTRGWPGKIAVVMIKSGTTHTLDDLRFMQEHYARPELIAERSLADVLCYYGNGGIQYDLSGNGNDGTVTGARIASGPLRAIHTPGQMIDLSVTVTPASILPFPMF